MIRRHLLLTFVAFLMCSTPALAAEVTMHGSTTVTTNLIVHHRAAIEAASGHTLNVVSSGSSSGIKSVTSGEAQIAMISAPLDKFSGASSELVAHKVGEAPVAFTTHISNGVKSLTRQQVKDILTGEITKWSEVGGPSFPIYVITERTGGGLRSMVEAELLGGKPISAKKRELPNASQIPKVVAQVPAALGIMSVALVDETIGRVELDEPLVQPFIFVTKGKPSPEVQAVIDAAKVATGMTKREAKAVVEAPKKEAPPVVLAPEVKKEEPKIQLKVKPTEDPVAKTKE